MTHKYDVVIATPGSSMESRYVNSLLETTAYLTDNSISWKYVNGVSSIVAIARERCLFKDPVNRGVGEEIFNGEFDYEKIFWIDSDMSWTVEEFMKLLNSDKDAITGSCVVGNNHDVAIFPEMCGYMLSKGAIISLPQKPQMIEACGMAFFVIRKGVFEATERPWFSDIEIKTKDRNGNDINWICGSEDIAFCERIRRAGFSIWADPTVRPGHIKKQILKI